MAEIKFYKSNFQPTKDFFWYINAYQKLSALVDRDAINVWSFVHRLAYTNLYSQMNSFVSRQSALLCELLPCKTQKIVNFTTKVKFSLVLLAKSE